MLQFSVIGNIGANAELRQENGSEFVTFKVAHNDRWTNTQGVQHDNTVWISCVMNGRNEGIFKYLTKGTQVFVQGDGEVRTYHSKSARAIVAGINIRVRSIQLVGAKPDEVPSVLFTQDGREVRINKYFLSTVGEVSELYSRSGEVFSVDPSGWVAPVVSSQQQQQQDQQQQQQEEVKQEEKQEEKTK